MPSATMAMRLCHGPCIHHSAPMLPRMPGTCFSSSAGIVSCEAIALPVVVVVCARPLQRHGEPEHVVQALGRAAELLPHGLHKGVAALPGVGLVLDLCGQLLGGVGNGGNGLLEDR